MEAPVRPNYELRVGMFTIIALILLLWGWGWLKSISLFRPPQRFIVQFHDVAGLNKNGTVNINGVRVGVIEKVELKAKGQVLVYPKITAENVVVPRGSKCTIQTLGLVGAKYLEVTLPEELPGQPPPPALQETDVLVGKDPVRVELVINDIATSISTMTGSLRSESFQRRFNDTLSNLNEVSVKINKGIPNFTRAADSVSITAQRFTTVADSTGGATASAQRFFNQGTQTMKSVDALSVNMRAASGKVNKFLDQPLMSSDLKAMVEQARQASDQIAVAMHQLNTTLGDEPTRQDLKQIMERLTQATENISNSIKTVNDLARDNELRGELKEMILNAKEALTQVGSVLAQPEFKGDIRSTIKQFRTAAYNVEVAAKQLQQVMGKRAPLLHMLFGKPGKMKEQSDLDQATPLKAPATTAPLVVPKEPTTTPPAVSPAAPKLERLQDGSPQGLMNIW